MNTVYTVLYVLEVAAVLLIWALFVKASSSIKNLREQRDNLLVTNHRLSTAILNASEPTINDIALAIHTANHQWWHDENGKRLDRNVGELLMLNVSELAEAMEGHRKGLRDDHLPQYPMFDCEIADTLIRAFDMAGSQLMSHPIGEVFARKLEYNRTRADHKWEARNAVGGKKY